jgi:hypothetical protein
LSGVEGVAWLETVHLEPCFLLWRNLDGCAETWVNFEKILPIRMVIAEVPIHVVLPVDLVALRYLAHNGNICARLFAGNS